MVIKIKKVRLGLDCNLSLNTLGMSELMSPRPVSRSYPHFETFDKFRVLK